MSKKYAVIKNGEVVNLILGPEEFTLKGFELVHLKDDEQVNIGDHYDGHNFIANT